MKAASSWLAAAVRAFGAGLRGTGRNVTGHWALAAVSLIAAFGIWVAVQDVDNPRATGFAPAGSGIEVKPINAPDDVIVEVTQTVKVEVEARKDVLPELKPGDFVAEVDVSSARPGEDGQEDVTILLPVRVRSQRDGVRVVGDAPRVPVTVARAASKEIAVTVRRTSRPPDGYEVVESPPPAVDPAIVVVRGRANRVAAVARVELDANLSGAREQTFTVEGDLVARSESGNVQGVTLTPSRGRATFRVDQLFSQRVMVLNPVIVGTPAPGYIITNVVVDPPTVVATGLKAIIDGLGQRPMGSGGGTSFPSAALNVEKLDVTNARQDITQTKQVELPANVSANRQTVVVKVEIRPATATATLIVAPSVEGTPPAGLVLDTGVLTTMVRVSGPVTAINALRPGDIKATFSLTGVGAGTSTLAVKATAPAGITIESADPVQVTLRAVQLP